MDNEKLKVLAYNLAQDVLERSDDQILITKAENLKQYLKTA